MSEEKDSNLRVASSVGIAAAAVLIGNLGESIERNGLLQAISDSRSTETREAAVAALAAFDKKRDDALALEMAFYKFSAALIVFMLFCMVIVIILAAIFS